MIQPVFKSSLLAITVRTQGMKGEGRMMMWTWQDNEGTEMRAIKESQKRVEQKSKERRPGIRRSRNSFRWPFWNVMSSITVIILYYLGWHSFECCGTSYRTAHFPPRITSRGLFQSRDYTRNLPHSLATSGAEWTDWFTFKCVLNVCALTLHWLCRKD